MFDLKLHAAETLPVPTYVTVNSNLRSTSARILLPQVSRALIAAGLTDKPVNYIKLYRSVLSGAIPAAQMTANRWSICPNDLPLIASVLGLTPATPAQPPEGRAPHASSSAV